MIRAAQRWVDGITAAKQSARSFPGDYVEIMYEALLEDPRQELVKICNFIGLEFETGMLKLGQPTENLGDAKGENGIVRGNYGKYHAQLAPQVQRKIEAISAQTLRELGYTSKYDGPPVRVPNITLRVYQLFDAANLIRAHVKQRGLLGAVAFHYQHFRHSRRKH
jgi:hypothetical protein